jgi:predicted small integral membrane protein
MAEWIYPQWQVFVGVAVLILSIVSIAVVEAKVGHTFAQKGFLPMPTTLGLRFFIGVISFLLIHFLWLLLFPGTTILIAFLLGVGVLASVMRWG